MSGTSLPGTGFLPSLTKLGAYGKVILDLYDFRMPLQLKIIRNPQKYARRKTMKRTLSLILAFVMLLGLLAGCVQRQSRASPHLRKNKYLLSITIRDAVGFVNYK